MTEEPSGWEIGVTILGNSFNFRWVGRDNISDIEVCTTRIVRGGRGFPWDERVAIHPMQDGNLEISRLRANEAQGEEHPC